MRPKTPPQVHLVARADARRPHQSIGDASCCAMVHTIFKPRTRDGLGFDWPISYEDVAPYYDKVEMLIGVYGSDEGLENTPDSPEGCLLPPPAVRVGERLIRQRADKLRIPVVPIHRAVLTGQLDYKTIPAKLHRRLVPLDGLRRRKISPAETRPGPPPTRPTPAVRLR